MRILIHDFGGYHFPLQLSRELAAHGYAVLHVYCASLPTTPPGIRDARQNPPDLKIVGLRLEEPLDKYDFPKRWKQENAYGRLIVRETERFKPDVVISANTPLDAQRPLLRHCKRNDIRFIYWLQDLLGVAALRILSKRLPGVGHLIGAYYARMERRLIRQSDAVIAIADEFKELLAYWGIPQRRIHVIPNWADPKGVPILPKRNGWSQAHDLDQSFCYLYAGTLGMKHNPNLLVDLALSMREESCVRIVVISQGLGASWLRAKKHSLNLTNLDILPYQPPSSMPSVLATGDVLVALLEPDAGLYSVPSKVLTYLCAGKPLLLAMPRENAAAGSVHEQMGLVVDPADKQTFLNVARNLYDRPELRLEYGASARTYAEIKFHWPAIYRRFEALLKAL